MREAFGTRTAENEPVRDDAWRKAQDDLQMKMNKQALANMERARADKDDVQKVRLKLN